MGLQVILITRFWRYYRSRIRYTGHYYIGRTAAAEERDGYYQEGQIWTNSTVPGSYERARGGGGATAREGGRCGVQGCRVWPDAAVIGSQERARGGSEAAA